MIPKEIQEKLGINADKIKLYKREGVFLLRIRLQEIVELITQTQILIIFSINKVRVDM